MRIRSIFEQYKYNIYLLLIFSLFIAIIQYCYPVPQVSWDGNYYIDISKHLTPSIRPVGYPVFLKILHKLWPSLTFVVYAQYIFWFFSVCVFLHVVRKIFPFNNTIYFIVAIVLLAEPTALYHCDTILSDILFSGFTLLYLATLLLYFRTGNILFIVFHVVCIFICLELRLLALFYPLFSVIALFCYVRPVRSALLISVIIICITYADHELNMHWNKRVHGVAVYSPFSGWTNANNAMYVLSYMRTNEKKIDAAGLQPLHAFLTSFFDTAHFKGSPASSDYIWDDRSPLNIYKRQIADSLKRMNGADPDFLSMMYMLAPLYSKYGIYIQTHYPYQYIRSFMIPNIASLISPHNGEMTDYYLGPLPQDNAITRYHLTPGIIYCRKQLYKDHINDINLIYYQVRLLFFALALIVLVLLRKRSSKALRMLLCITATFTLLYFGAMLYSSRFMPRYLIPVLPLITIVIIITGISIIRNRKISATSL